MQRQVGGSRATAGGAARERRRARLFGGHRLDSGVPNTQVVIWRITAAIGIYEKAANIGGTTLSPATCRASVQHDAARMPRAVRRRGFCGPRRGLQSQDGVAEGRLCVRECRGG